MLSVTASPFPPLSLFDCLVTFVSFNLTSDIRCPSQTETFSVVSLPPWLVLSSEPLVQLRLLWVGLSLCVFLCVSVCFSMSLCLSMSLCGCNSSAALGYFQPCPCYCAFKPQSREQSGGSSTLW